MSLTLSFIRRSSAAGALALAALAAAAPLAAHAQARNGAAASDCRNCGTVEAVNPVQRAGRANGIAGTPVTPGMAIGGVVGGILGNQVGSGNGRTAATVVGAAGGAYAGHAIENSQNRYTAYVMHIRMNDGTRRTVEQRTALPRGAKVIVRGHTAHLR
ncbi:glycine zipper 2TM domain-containing protein [Caenimonas terrae]|uniref:Glycine zipper 2TM domain-containing protein n=1 Tax=Caenimonas terrae TaxID=696074 RepID=A0ABW0NHF8_9BURK